MKPAPRPLPFAISRLASIAGLLAATVLLLSACETEQIRRNDEILRRQEDELRQLREEKRQREAGERPRTGIEQEEERAERRRLSCNEAFLSFEKAPAAQAEGNPLDAVALYRKGLNLCPDDDAAHYELGKILAGLGRREEARREFAAALRINPDFKGAQQELDKLER